MTIGHVEGVGRQQPAYLENNILTESGIIPSLDTVASISSRVIEHMAKLSQVKYTISGPGGVQIPLSEAKIIPIQS